MIKRILVAIPALVLLFFAVYFHGWYLKTAVGILAVIGSHEVSKVVGKGEAKPLRWAGYVFSVLLVPAYVFAAFSGIAILLALAVMSIFIVLVLTGKDVRNGAYSALPFVYPGLFFVFLIALACIPQKSVSQFMISIVFVSAVVTDTFAYFSGMLCGKHKLAPSISPKKTVEGAIGGTVFGTCAVVLLGVFMQGAFDVDITPYWYIPLGLALSVLTQFGDLSASVIKRKFGAKDFGNIMAGHGGVMDRLDSVLFICPLVYAFYLAL